VNDGLSLNQVFYFLNAQKRLAINVIKGTTAIAIMVESRGVVMPLLSRVARTKVLNPNPPAAIKKNLLIALFADCAFDLNDQK
jgi:hypothetical protein